MSLVDPPDSGAALSPELAPDRGQRWQIAAVEGEHVRSCSPLEMPACECDPTRSL